MKTGIMKILCLLLFCFLLGCAALQELIQKPTLTYETISFRDISFLDGTMVFHFRIHNPNPVGIRVDRIRYHLKINEKDFIQGNLDQGIALPISGSAPLELPIQITYLDFFQSVSDFIKNDKVAYNLTGSVKVGPFDVPYQTRGELDIPQLPKIYLNKITVQNLSLTGASVIFKITISNTNDFAVPVTGLTYQIDLGGTSFADGMVSQLNILEKNNKSELEIPLNLNMIQLGQSLYQLLKSSNTNYKIYGNMIIPGPAGEEKIFPFDFSGMINISR